MKYSIIIPAYNAESTLPRCLDSLVTQLPSDAEILLINDGSSDGTEEICHSYAARYAGIKTFSKPNGGVSSARNIGLNNAEGEYVLFVDADDAVSNDYFLVLGKALMCAPDLLQFRKLSIGKHKLCSTNRDSCVFSDDILKTSKQLSGNLRKQELNLITTKAFKRDIIETNKIRFNEQLDIGEDKAFAFSYALHSLIIKTISTPLYFLSTDDPNSLSRKKRDYLCESILYEHRIMRDELENSDIAEKCKEYYRNALCYSFYRSAYTVVGELRKYDLSRKERVAKTGEILEAYSRETWFTPKELFCKCVALPVKKKFALLVDSVMLCYNNRGHL